MVEGEILRLRLRMTEDGRTPRLRRATHHDLLSPIRRRGGILVHLGLVIERVAQQFPQAVDLGIIPVPGRPFNRDLDKIIPQDVFGIAGIHARLAFDVHAVLGFEPRAIPIRPPVESFTIKELIP